MCMTLSSPAAAGGVGGPAATTGGSGRTTWTGAATGGLDRTGARIFFEIGGSTDFGFGSEPGSSERLDRLSSINETVSGFGGAAGGGCAAAGATVGAAAGVGGIGAAGEG